MKKLYFIVTAVVLLSTTAFISADHKTKNRKKNINPLADKAVIDLNAEDKSVLFSAHAEDVHASLKGKKPSLEAFTAALKVHHTLKGEGLLKNDKLLTIIDFTLPSTEKRLWVIDMDAKKILENIVVSHGKNSGINEVESFSNKSNSYQSSMGAYLTSENYVGKHGLSLRLDGLEEGINDNARQRAIVMHTAEYANPALIKRQGRLGRSLGCPAIPTSKLDLIKKLSGGSVLYIHGNDENYTSQTRFKSIDTAYAVAENETVENKLEVAENEMHI